MAGPSVAVRILGDLSQWSKSIAGAGAAAETGGKRISGAFSSVLGVLNKTGVLGPFQGAFESAGEAMDALAKKGGTVGEKLLGTGGAIAGLGVGLLTFGSAQKQAQQQLSTAIDNTGHSYSEYAKDIQGAVKEEEKHGETASDTMTALQKLTQATGDPKKALDLLGEASDLAAAKHEDLGTAATQLGKAYNGSNKIFKEFGISVASSKAATTDLTRANKELTKANNESDKAAQKLADVQASLAGKTTLTAAEQKKLKDAQAGVVKASADQRKAHQDVANAQKEVKDTSNAQGDAMTALAGKIKGQANAASDTFTGKLKGIKAAVEDNVATFANKFGPAITGAGSAMAGLGAAMEVGKGIQEAYKTATENQTLAQAALNLVMDANPFVLVVIAIAALVAAIVIAYNHVTWFRDIVNTAWKDIQKAWDGVVAVFKAVIDWLKKNWEPILVGLIAGPFGLVVLEVIKHWDAIWTFLKELPGKILGYFKDAEKWLEQVGIDIVNGLVGGAKSIAVGFWTWLSGFPGRIKGEFAGAIHWLEQIGKDILNGLVKGIESVAEAPVKAVEKAADGVKNVAKKVLSIFSPSKVFEEFGRSTMQGFTQGVNATANTAVNAVSGAMGDVTGVGATASTSTTSNGAAIHIENYHASSDVDISLLAQKLTAVLSARRV